jgi:hypothetical protein
MAFLSDNLRLEIKSIYDSNLVQFASYKKDANIHMVPKDSISHYSVITASAHSNIDTHITLHSDDAEIEVAIFSSNSISFGNDTLLRGNLIVMGSIFALGYDVLTQENTFLLNNFGSSAQKGINSAAEKNLRYLNHIAQTTSNDIINYVNKDLSNMEEALGISQLTSFQNNMFTINDFENLFALKTLDDFAQGSSNHFIINNEYMPVSPVNATVIINGTITSSNLYTNSISTDSIYADKFVGDATNVFNVNREHFNTNQLIETQSSSNQYFTYERAGILATASNINSSNYITSLQQYHNTLLATSEHHTSNFIIVFQSNIIGNYEAYYDDLKAYIVQKNNITYDIFDTRHDTLVSYFNDISNNLLSLCYIIDNNLSNYISYSSNTLIDEMNVSVQSASQYNTNTSNNLYNALSILPETHEDLLKNASKNSLSSLLSSNADASNLVLSMLSLSILTIDILSHVSQELSTKTMTQTVHTANYLQETSNNSIHHINAAFEIANTDAAHISNYIILSLTSAANNLSNYATSTIQNINNTMDASYAFINDRDITRGIKAYSNLSLASTSNIIHNVSNIILNRATEFKHDKDAFYNTMQSSVATLIRGITTDDIPELSASAYYTLERFNHSLHRKTLDDLSGAIGGSNNIIRKQIYDDNLTIDGHITAQNIVVYGDATFKVDVWNTERLEIENWSNTPAVSFFNDDTDDSSIMNLGSIFTMKTNGSVGIHTSSPTETLDVFGTIASDFFHGSGKFLKEIHLLDRSTAYLQEGSSNIYYHDDRVCDILIASNMQTSNDIQSLVDFIYAENLAVMTSNSIVSRVFNDDMQCSNYFLEAAEETHAYIIETPENQWNYAIATSNTLAEYILALDASQSNYILDKTLEIEAQYDRSQANILNYLHGLQSFNPPYTHISNVSNILATKIDTIISDHSNLIFTLSNLFASTYESFHSLDALYLSVASYSNSMDMTSNALVSEMKTNIISMLPYNAGDLYPYTHIYTPVLLHLNFKDKKILNGVDTDDFRLYTVSSNYTNIYPVVGSLMQPFYIYVNRQYEIKKLMNTLNAYATPIAIHFAFYATALATSASIFKIASDRKSYLHIYVSDSQLNFDTQEIHFSGDTGILSNTWYSVDIVFNQTNGSVVLDMSINNISQQFMASYADNLAYERGNNTTMYIGSTDVKLQDFKIYVQNMQEYSITSNVVIKPVRWLESPNYASNYFSPSGRYITTSCNVCIGKIDAAEATLDIYTGDPDMYSIKTNKPIWVQSALLASSDERIKTNIRDFEKADALRQIMEIQPKTYEYIQQQRTELVYGFSAQQVSSIIPNAICLRINSIPNINSIGILYDKYFIAIQGLHLPLAQILLPSTIVLYHNNNVYYEEIESIINPKTMKIANHSGLPDAAIFVYGTVVEDFHTLDKNYIYTLNVCATQELFVRQDAFASNIMYQTSNIHNNHIEGLYHDTSNTKELVQKMTGIIDDAYINTANAWNTLEQIDYNLNVNSMVKTEEISRYVSTFLNKLLYCESNCQKHIQENISIFDDFGGKLEALHIMQNDIDKINKILSANSSM